MSIRRRVIQRSRINLVRTVRSSASGAMIIGDKRVSNIWLAGCYLLAGGKIEIDLLREKLTADPLGIATTNTMK